MENRLNRQLADDASMFRPGVDQARTPIAAPSR